MRIEFNASCALARASGSGFAVVGRHTGPSLCVVTVITVIALPNPTTLALDDSPQPSSSDLRPHDCGDNSDYDAYSFPIHSAFMIELGTE